MFPRIDIVGNIGLAAYFPSAAKPHMSSPLIYRVLGRRQRPARSDGRRPQMSVLMMRLDRFVEALCHAAQEPLSVLRLYPDRARARSLGLT